MSDLWWKCSYDKWFTLYRGDRVIGFVAGDLMQFDCDWRIVKPGPKFSTPYRTVVEAAKVLLEEARKS